MATRSVLYRNRSRFYTLAMNHEVQKSRVCLIRVLEAEDRDTEGKQTGENFLETTKHLSSAIKGPAGIKKRRHTPINLI